jgi:hypothetical protein
MDLGSDSPLAKNQTMQRLILVLLILTSLTGCHGTGAHARSKQRAATSIEPERREAVDSMRAAQTEASQQLNNW